MCVREPDEVPAGLGCFRRLAPPAASGQIAALEANNFALGPADLIVQRELAPPPTPQHAPHAPNEPARLANGPDLLS